MKSHPRRSRATAALILLAALVTAAFLAPGAGAAKRPSGEVQSGGDLYLLQAEGGVLSGTKLVLHGVAPSVTDFTDRPRRAAGAVPAGRFASGWTSTFGTVAPNAALEVQGAPKNRDVALLEPRAPRYDAKAATLTFKVKRLNHTGDTALTEFDRRADGDAVKSFGSASLFVDSGGEPLEPAEIRVSIPQSSNLKIEFAGGASFNSGAFISGIETPPTFGQPANSTGLIFLQSSALTFEATGGAGMEAETLIYVSQSEGKVSGQATVPAGAEVTIAIADKPTQKLTNGKFSIPG